jgi:thiol-disulfide isomerase/thioredoxin
MGRVRIKNSPIESQTMEHARAFTLMAAALLLAGCVVPEARPPVARIEAPAINVIIPPAATPEATPAATPAGTPGATPEATAAASPSPTAAPAFQGRVLAGTQAKLYDFVKSDYDAALQTDKLVVLYFYATWCPICAAELPRLYGAFDELSTDRVVGFRVNYNDGDTDDDERELARAHGVAYQHTKVFVRNGQRVYKAPDAWDKARYLSEITRALAG